MGRLSYTQINFRLIYHCDRNRHSMRHLCDSKSNTMSINLILTANLLTDLKQYRFFISIFLNALLQNNFFGKSHLTPLFGLHGKNIHMAVI